MLITYIRDRPLSDENVCVYVYILYICITRIASYIGDTATTS